MNNLIFLLSTGIMLLLFTSYYLLILKENKNFLFNRIYLIGIGLLSFFLSIPGMFLRNDHKLISYTLDSLEISSINKSDSWASLPTDFSSIFLVVYVAGVVVAVTINIVAYHKIMRIIREGIKTKFYDSTVIVNEAAGDSFSFLNSIVVPNTRVSRYVIAHEEAHVRGNHSIDLLFAELVCTVLWFIPFIRLYKKAIVLNHEFIADNISGSKSSRQAYCEHLLANTIGIPEFSLSHTFSHPSLTKSRIKMMYKNPVSKLRTIGGSLLFVPVVMVAVFISSCKDEFQSKSDMSNNKQLAGQIEVMPEFPGGNEALIAYLSNNITYPESAKSDKTEGKVFIKFTVAANGKVKDVTVTKGVNEALDFEAVRVISFMPDWKPGIKNGEPVDMQMTIPILFKLE